MKCRACGEEHEAWIRCEVAARTKDSGGCIASEGRDQNPTTREGLGQNGGRMGPISSPGEATRAIGVESQSGRRSLGPKAILGKVVGLSEEAIREGLHLGRTANRRSRKAYNAYQREYMRRYRESKRAKVLGDVPPTDVSKSGAE